MTIDFQRDKPIYQQLLDRLSSEIVRGDRKPGDKLPSVRDYAIETGVNPNTMSRTYKELEVMGIAETRRGQGTFVTEDEERLEQLRNEMKTKHTESFVSQMKDLGFSIDEMIEELKENKEGDS
ncbi:GntR family transcriptional regulator [Pontibacillus marinus]|uniref:GntR family transcriptional regulator n=1 Tax=Pontibacillus marinus BH030004 = DSM 16465 TaxID=1385511 RepID=A0A0A5FXV9_9BACI|nr:GntR family transcriptional regulator [Pontibacillus marinus]KGX83668.1 GntR family transcriptional regulator [Pontibacillus marinus BH030004 = DSM 16465]